MKTIRPFIQILSCSLALLLAVPFSAMSQQIQERVTAPSPEKVLRPEELEQMLAPIALYPDALLAQVLAAATYPLEVVAADRFVKNNPGLKGEALLEAVKDRDWEPSVKAMLEFPDVLAMMDEQLEWTQRLGEAFLAQQGDCMDAVQRLRQKAYAQGNLATTDKQVIIVEPQAQIIIIEPARPGVVYVPVYDTAVIYGRWWYPGHPPYYFYLRRHSGITFFSVVFVGGMWGFWGTWDCNWHSRHVYINVNHYNDFTRHHYREGTRYRFYKDGQGSQPWRHASQQRAGARHETQAPIVTVRPRTPDVRRHDQSAVSAPTVNPRESVQQAATTSNSNRDDQPGIRRVPARLLRENAAYRDSTARRTTIESRNAAGGQVSVAAPPRESRARESATAPIATSTVKEDTKESVVVRPQPSDASRNRDDADAMAPGDRGSRRHEANDSVQQNRQAPASMQGSAVLREDPIRERDHSKFGERMTGRAGMMRPESR